MKLHEYIDKKKAEARAAREKTELEKLRKELQDAILEQMWLAKKLEFAEIDNRRMVVELDMMREKYEKKK